MNTVVEAIQAEFADISDLRTCVTVSFRLLLAMLLGGCLGYERESKGKSAGLRTHMLVAIGATLFVMGPRLAGFVDADMSRVIQGLVAGVGFLGAGAIVKGRPGEEIEGLTTAASIWMAAALGATVGMGEASMAVLTTVVSLLILVAWSSGSGKSASRSATKRGGASEREELR